MEEISKNPNIPSPPPPEVGLRTMESDLKAVKESGGSISGSQLRVSVPTAIPKPEPEPFSAPEYTALEKSISQPAAPLVIPSKVKSNFFKSFLIIVGILIFIGGLGLLGYFVVYPLVFPPKETAAPYVPPSPPIPPITTSTPTSTPEAPAITTHHSLFKTMPLGGLKEITITDFSKEAIIAGLSSVFKPNESLGSLREVVLFYKNGIVSANQFIKIIFPELQSSNSLNPIFESDFSIFVFQDKKGDWPGFVAKIKDPKNESSLRENLTKLESSNNIKNLYLADPGVMQGFKDGKVDNISVRYATFAKSGAAFNYALKNNFLIVATSYSAMQAVIDILP